MDTPPSSARLAAERKALQLLCSPELNPVRRAQICATIVIPTFTDSLHRVVFEEILAVGSIHVCRLRELLPARITNRGFPDFEAGFLFESTNLPMGDVEAPLRATLRLLVLDKTDAKD